MLAAAVNDHIFWITSRAAGTVALLFSSISVCAGLLMGGRMIQAKGRMPDLRITHEALSLATLMALVVHAVSLLGDSYLKPSVTDISIPFASSYKEPWMVIGIVGGWLLLILGVSFYFRARIGVQRWRRMHRFTALAWILGVVHSLGEGTDARQLWFLAATAIVVVPAACLLLVRTLGPRATPAPRPAAGQVPG